MKDNGEDSFAAAVHGGSFWNSSVVATDSVADTKTFNDDEMIDISVEQEDDDEEEEEEERIMCAKSYGNSWKCKSYAARSNSLCQLHLEKLQKRLPQPSSSTTTTKRKHKKKEKTEKADTVTSESSRSRVRGRKTTMSTTNPYEFYYYSGFGPSWGKKRGAIATTTKTDEIVAEKENVYSSSETDKIDFFDEEEEEEESAGGMGKRRGRKRIKARSLKSLM